MLIINKDYISKVNTYEGKNKAKYIVIHETDNRNNGAGAERHAYAQSKGNLNTSVHFYVGSDGVYQAAELSDGTYSVGVNYSNNHTVTDATNRNTINIEICVNADGDYNVARVNAIELVKYLIQTTSIPAERVIRHYDAKGKYCPRKMLDNPVLWEDFKSQIGNTTKADTVEKSNTETWYRVGTGWKNGICQNQKGAYHNLSYAIADCAAGYNVYDSAGKVIHTGGRTVEQDSMEYSLRQFVRDVQEATGSNVDGYAGDETIGNTPTISSNVNKNHPVVTALERRLKVLGFYSGTVEADEGKVPCFGGKMKTAVNTYQKEVLGYKKPDGKLSAGKKMWKSLLDMI